MSRRHLQLCEPRRLCIVLGLALSVGACGTGDEEGMGRERRGQSVFPMVHLAAVGNISYSKTRLDGQYLYGVGVTSTGSTLFRVDLAAVPTHGPQSGGQAEALFATDSQSEVIGLEVEPQANGSIYFGVEQLPAPATGVKKALQAVKKLLPGWLTGGDESIYMTTLYRLRKSDQVPSVVVKNIPTQNTNRGSELWIGIDDQRLYWATSMWRFDPDKDFGGVIRAMAKPGLTVTAVENTSTEILACGLKELNGRWMPAVHVGATHVYWMTQDTDFKKGGTVSAFWRAPKQGFVGHPRSIEDLAAVKATRTKIAEWSYECKDCAEALWGFTADDERLYAVVKDYSMSTNAGPTFKIVHQLKDGATGLVPASAAIAFSTIGYEQNLYTATDASGIALLHIDASSLKASIATPGCGKKQFQEQTFTISQVPLGAIGTGNVQLETLHSATNSSFYWFTGGCIMATPNAVMAKTADAVYAVTPENAIYRLPVD
ncbi:MAG: hypothetical protein IT371_16335 [Deltaproteobacteria bacterium]|nr:hypothetical protein [Deltaproteobacteria bacterium]